MSIPGFQSFLLPVLQVLVGRNELHVKQLPGLAADNLGISGEDRLIKLKVGRLAFITEHVGLLHISEMRGLSKVLKGYGENNQ